MQVKSGKFTKRLVSVILMVVMIFSVCIPAAAETQKTIAPAVSVTELMVGETAALKVCGWNIKTFWTSADENVATVDCKGVVTAVAEGETTITARSRSFFGMIKKMEFYIIVKPFEADVTIEIGEDVELVVDACGITTWKTDDESIAMVDNGIVTGIGEGVATITATTMKKVGFFWFLGLGKTVKTVETFTVEVKANGTTGDEEIPEGTYCVTFDSNGGSEIEPQYVNAGETAAFPGAPEKEGFAFIGWYVDNEYSSLFDFSEPVNASCTVIARWLNVTDTTDTDDDGFTDAVEEFLGTDPSENDTDGDGLSDYIESATMNYDPLNADTDNDGTPDGEEDLDQDGIDNITEIELGTDLTRNDTDDDGLEDKEEFDTYGTDPINEDTDGDGVSDGKEVELGTDPLSAQSSFKLNISADNEDDSVTPSVEIELPGDQVESLRIDPIEDDIFFPETIPGYLGKAYDFYVNGTFSTAKISFKFDRSKLAADAEPTIYYFNEEDQQLEELETIIDGDIASTTVTHFSTYILIDRKIFQESFTWIDVWDSEKTYENVEIVMVIDDSGSLGGDYGYNSSTGTFTGGKDPEHKRLEVARNFVSNANSKAKIGIVKFDSLIDDVAGGLIECTEDGKNTLKNYLKFTYRDDSYSYNLPNIFDSRGQTYMYTGIEKALGMFSANSDSTLKVVVVFTDGEAWDEDMHSSVVNNALAKDIKIYTVGLGTSSQYFDDYLIPLANSTGGAFYYASNADELDNIYENISDKIDLSADSDDDGIPDYYEDHMVYFNGVGMVLDKNNPDTDGDNLEDGEEVVLEYIYNEDKTQVKVIGKLNSDPSKKDTDSDGYIDSEDKNPLVWDISDRDLAISAGISYTDLAKGTRIDTSSIGLNNGANVNEMIGWTVLDTWHGGAGFYAAALKKDKNIVLAFRGSKPNYNWGEIIDTDWIDDWFYADFINLITGISTQAPAAQMFTEKIINNYSGYNIYICGHSLGGNLALNASIKALDVKPSVVKRVSTFNGLAMPNIKIYAELFTMDFTTLFSYEDRFYDYEIEGDFVSGLEFAPDHKWYNVFDLALTTGVGYRPSPLPQKAKSAHSLENFYLQMEPLGRPIN